MKLTIEAHFFSNGSCYYKVQNEDGKVLADCNAAPVTNWRRVLECVAGFSSVKGWLDEYQTPAPVIDMNQEVLGAFPLIKENSRG